MELSGDTSCPFHKMDEDFEFILKSRSHDIYDIEIPKTDFDDLLLSSYERESQGNPNNTDDPYHDNSGNATLPCTEDDVNVQKYQSFFDASGVFESDPVLVSNTAHERSIVVAAPKIYRPMVPFRAQEVEEREDEDVTTRFVDCIRKYIPDMASSVGCEMEANKNISNQTALKSRPVGALNFPSPFQDKDGGCPCGCTTRTQRSCAPSDVTAHGVLSGFVHTGFIYDGMVIAMVIPFGPPLIGTFAFDAYGPTKPLPSVHIRDAASGLLFCCPMRWLFHGCLDLLSAKAVGKPNEVVKMLYSHIKSSTCGYRFLFVPELNAQLHQLSIVVRHCINNTPHEKIEKNGSIVSVPVDIRRVNFMGRPELTEIFEGMHTEFNADAAWQRSMTLAVEKLKRKLTTWQKLFLVLSWVAPSASVQKQLMNTAMHHMYECTDVIDKLARVYMEEFLETTKQCILPDPSVHVKKEEDISNDDIELCYPKSVPLLPIKEHFMACPFECDSKSGPVCSNPVVVFGMLAWLYGGQIVFLEHAIQGSDPIPGLLYYVPNSDNPDVPKNEIIDLVTKRVHCCPRSWLYATYIRLFADGNICDTPQMVEEIQINLSSQAHVMDHIYIPEYDLYFSDLLNVYHQTVKMYRGHGDNPKKKSKARPKKPKKVVGTEDESAMFPAIEDIVSNYETVKKATWPQNRKWTRLVISEMRHTEKHIQTCREACLSMMQHLRPNKLNPILVDVPLIDMKTNALLLGNLHACVFEDFFK